MSTERTMSPEPDFRELQLRKPTIVTRVGLARQAAERWRSVHYDEYRDVWRHGDNMREIGMRLAALDPPTPDEVDRIIGNGSWTACTCRQCNQDVDAVAQIGEPLGDESRTTSLCLPCLRAAAESLARVTESP